MTNKYGVTYLSVGELREAMTNVPDDACVDLRYVADADGFKQVLHSTFAHDAHLNDYGPDLDPDLTGYEFVISTKAALEY